MLGISYCFLILWPVEMGSSRCPEKSFLGTTHGRVRGDGKIYWRWSRTSSAPRWLSSVPRWKKGSSSFPKPRGQARVPNFCAIGWGTVQSGPGSAQTRCVQTLPNPASLVSVPSCALAGATPLRPGPQWGPRLEPVLGWTLVAAGTEWLLPKRTCRQMSKPRNERVLPTNIFVKLCCYYVGLGKERAGFQTNYILFPNSSQACVGSSLPLIWFLNQTRFLPHDDHHLASTAYASKWLDLSPLSSCFLLCMLLAKEFRLPFLLFSQCSLLVTGNQSFPPTSGIRSWGWRMWQPLGALRMPWLLSE